jgi:hypothetical protein
VGFVGDLDPLDLTVFLAYSGNAELLRPTARRLPLRLEWTGVNDRWLNLCERNFRPQYSRKHVTIKMTPTESEHQEVIENILAGRDLDSFVGPHSAALLRSGYKLEVEGASNPAFYKKPFVEQLRGLLAGKNR